MNRRSRAALLFAALAVALFWRVLFQGETLIATDHLKRSPIWQSPPASPRNPWLSDSVEYYYPSERLYSEAVRRGELPLVNPYVFNGAPIPHGIHIWNSVWPVKLAFLLLFDPIRSYDLFAIAHWWLAAFAMLLFLRSVEVSPWPAFAAALAYALSGRAMLWLHGHYLMATMAYTPLVFLAARKNSALGAIPLAGLFFSNPQIALGVSAAVILWKRSSWTFVVPGLLLAGVALVPLAVTVSGGLRDPRMEAGWFYRDGFGCWLWLAGLVAPDAVSGSMPPNEYNIYLGLLPLAGALLGVRHEKFFAGMAGLALAVATLYPLPVWLSPVAFSLPTRYLFFFTFGATICFARGLDAQPRAPWVYRVVLLLILVDLVPRFQAWNPSFDPAPLRERPPAVAAMKGRVGLHLAERDRPFFPPLSIFGLASIQGYDSSVPRAQADAIAGAGEVAGQRLIRLTDPESPVLDRLGMRTLVTEPDYQSRRYRLVYDGAVRVWENPHAGIVPPRAVSKTPLWIGLGLTLIGAAAAVAGGLLDHLRRQRYS